MKNLTVDNYYEEDEYMSVSAFKKMRRCEIATDESLNQKSDALLIGSYVDAYIEGTLDKFRAENPEIFSSRGSTKGELKSDFKYADSICEYIDGNKTLTQFLSGEKQRIMTGEINGIPFKIKMDSYSQGIAINDLKVMKTVTDNQGNYYDFVTPWGYDIQLACYQEIVRQNTGEQLPCYICAVTKEKPINSVIINIPQPFLDKALALVESEIQHLYDVKVGKEPPIGCGKCPTCISLKTDTEIISLDSLTNLI